MQNKNRIMLLLFLTIKEILLLLHFKFSQATIMISLLKMYLRMLDFVNC